MNRLIKKITLSNIYLFLVYSLLFLCGLHFFDLTGYFFLAITLLVFLKALVCKKVRFTRGLLFVTLFSIFFFVFFCLTYKFEIKTIIQYLIGPFCLFVYGQSIATSDNKEKEIFNGLFFYVSGLSFLTIINVLYSGANMGFFSSIRNFYYVWTPGITKSSTLFSIHADIIAAFSIGVLFWKKTNRKWYYVLFSSIGLILSIYFSIVLSNRSFFITLIVALLVAILLSLKRNKKMFYPFFISIIFISSFLLIWLLLIYSNVFGLGELALRVPLLQRFLMGGSNSLRLEIYKTFFMNFWKYPFGGLSTSGLLMNGSETTEFVHNTFLDVYAESGLIPCILILYIFYASIRGFINILKCKDFNNDFLFIAFIGVLGGFLFEPVVISDPYIFGVFFIFCGYFEFCRYIYNPFKRIKAIDNKQYKVVYISNFYSIHVSPICDELSSILGNRFMFIATKPISKEHSSYGANAKKDNYFEMFGGQKEIQKGHEYLKDADIILYDTVSWRIINKYRLNKKKIIIRVSERFYRKGFYSYLSPRAVISPYIHLRPFDFNNEYVLTMSSYTSTDCVESSISPNKIYKWGYWTETDNCKRDKFDVGDVVKLVFVNRLIPCKNIEQLLRVAKRLKDNKKPFSLTIIGSGEKQYTKDVVSLATSLDVLDQVRFAGSMSNDLVKKELLASDVIISCSNQEEGWGATINEGLSCGCSAVCSYYCGSANELIRNGFNGFIYDFDNDSDLYEKLSYLIDNPSELKQQKINAYDYYNSTFTPSIKAKELCSFLDHIVSGDVNDKNVSLRKSTPISEETVRKKAITFRQSFTTNSKKINNKTNTISNYKKGAIISYATIFLNIIAALLYTPWMISQLGSSDYALHSLSISIVSLITIDIGIGAIVSKYIAQFRSKGLNEEANKFTGVVFKIYFVLTSIVFITLLVLFFFIEKIYLGLSIDEINKFKIAYIIVGFHTLFAFEFTPINGILIGNEKFHVSKLFSLISKILNICLVIVFLANGQGLYAFVLINTFTEVISILGKIIYLRKNKLFGSKPSFKANNKTYLALLLKMSFWTIVITLTGKALTNLNQSILGIFSNSEQISIFAVAMVFEGYCYEFSAAINGMFIPKLTQMEENKEPDSEFTKLTIKVGRLQLLFVGFIMVGILAFGRSFINDVWKINAGTSFDLSYFCIIFLLAPCFFTFSMQIPISLQYVRNKLKYLALCYIVSAVVSIGLSCLLCIIFPSSGALMVSISFCVGKMLGHVVLQFFIQHKVLKLNVWQMFKECFLKCFLSLGITLGIGLLMEYFLPLKGTTGFIIKVGLLSIFYVAIMCPLFFNQFEKNMVLNTVLPILKRLSVRLEEEKTNCELFKEMNECSTENKVAIINECDYKSTGNICKDISEELISKGFSVLLCTNSNKSKNYYQYHIHSSIVDYQLNRALVKIRGTDGFQNEESTINLINKLDDFKPDVLFLHNLHGHYINFPMIMKWAKENKTRIVWTLHDCWIFTGRCAHFDGVNCRGWMEGCNACNYPSKYPKAFFRGREKMMLQSKQNIINNNENITFVCPSKWIQTVMNKSNYNSHKSIVINNGISFSPFEEKDVFNMLSLKKDDKYVLCVANPWSNLKGLESIYKVNKAMNDSNVFFVVVGLNKTNNISRSGNLISLPVIYDRNVLMSLFKNASLFFNPTLEDTFPTVNIESLFCGTPVLTFESGGSPEIITNETGYVVKKNDIDACVSIISTHEKTPQLTNKCHERSMLFDRKKMVDAYSKLLKVNASFDDNKTFFSLTI